VLFVSVIGGQTVSALSEQVADGLGWGSGVWLEVLARVVALGVSIVLFFVIFRLVARPDIEAASLWKAAVVGGVAFELMKLLSFLLLGSVRGSPAFQAFGVAIVLLVWIHYFAQVVFYAASLAGELSRKLPTSPVAPELQST
jgi:membrane protein